MGVLRDDILRELPLVEEIEDKRLKELVIQIWLEAASRGRWNTLKGIPFTLLIKPAPYDLMEHTRMVASMALAIGRARGDVNLDLLLAGALLHDVGKLLEYKKKDGTYVLSTNGKYLRHPISGASLILEMGGDEALAHIVAAHSKEGNLLKTGRSPEATIIYHLDFIDFEIAKQMK